MKWILMVAIIVGILACIFCVFTLGIPSLNKISVSDEAPAFPTMEPISVAKPIFVQDVTGAPLYLYSNATSTRDT